MGARLPLSVPGVGLRLAHLGAQAAYRLDWLQGIGGEVGSLEWWGGALFALSLALGALAPALDLAGVLDPIGALDGQFGPSTGGGMFSGGFISTLLAQISMGDSWRIGIDRGEKTKLVTDGAFQYIRNPIFSAMIPTSLGIALLVPNVLAIVAVGLLIVALETQTRHVEEPYLIDVHGRAYAEYAAFAGRFLPLIGRLR